MTTPTRIKGSGRFAYFVARLHRSPVGWLVWSSLVSVLISSALKGPYTPSALGDSLDLISWRVYSALASDSGQTATVPRAGVVLGISQRYFETRFGQSSPLDRMELAGLLGAVNDVIRQSRASDPARSIVVAIDLDLSPPTRPGSQHAPGQLALERSLGQLAESASVVLLCPFEVLTEEANQIKRQWMARIAATGGEASPHSGLPGRGIWFASADLLEQFGAVLQYDPTQATLGTQAGRALRGQAPRQDPGPVCAAGAGGPGPGTVTTIPRLAKISSTALSSVSILEVDDASLVTAFLDPRQIELVVVGGTYKLGADEFQAADGRFYPGAALHAAVAYTEVRPISQRHRLAEPAIGVLLACLLQLISKPLTLIIPVLLQPPSVLTLRNPGASPWTFLLFAPRASDTPELWLRWLVAAMLMSAFLALILIATGYLSASLMRFADYWVDFGMLSLVIFLKVLSGISLKVQAHGVAPLYLPSERAHGELTERSEPANTPGEPTVQQVPFRRLLMTRIGIAVRASVLAYGSYSLVYKIIA